MASDQALSFDKHPVESGKQLIFEEVTLGTGETTILIDLKGKVRLCAIAHPAGAEGTEITVKANVPFTSGYALQTITDLTIALTAGEVTPLPFADWFWLEEVELTLNAAQSGAAAVIGFYAWRGRVE